MSSQPPFPAESRRSWNCGGEQLSEWTSEGNRKGETQVCAPEQTLRHQGQRIMVRDEWVRLCTKPGGTAGIFLSQLLSGAGFLFAPNLKECEL